MENKCPWRGECYLKFCRDLNWITVFNQHIIYKRFVLGPSVLTLKPCKKKIKKESSGLKRSFQVSYSVYLIYNSIYFILPFWTLEVRCFFFFFFVSLNCNPLHIQHVTHETKRWLSIVPFIYLFIFLKSPFLF